MVVKTDWDDILTVIIRPLTSARIWCSVAKPEWTRTDPGTPGTREWSFYQILSVGAEGKGVVCLDGLPLQRTGQASCL